MVQDLPFTFENCPVDQENIFLYWIRRFPLRFYRSLNWTPSSAAESSSHYISTVQFYITLTSTLTSPMWFLSLRLFRQKCVWLSHFPHAFYIPRLSILPGLTVTILRTVTNGRLLYSRCWTFSFSFQRVNCSLGSLIVWSEGNKLWSFSLRNCIQSDNLHN
jgi:hypothetical protein